MTPPVGGLKRTASWRGRACLDEHVTTFAISRGPQMSRPRGRALGRGLEALIPIGPEGTAGVVGANGIPEHIDVDQIIASPGQMRKQFPAEALRELADSIRRHGIIQPILVRRLPEGYELIAGERRWRAARMAGLERIPAIVRHEATEESLLLGLIENLQREDLNPIEEA